MIEKGKQITLNQRIRIEEMLNQRRRKYEIANELDKTQSTIAREINLNEFQVHVNWEIFNIKLILILFKFVDLINIGMSLESSR